MEVLDKQRIIQLNFDAFEAMLPALIANEKGKYALMHNAAVVEFFDSAAQAVAKGEEQFADGLFSVQRVESEVVDLGFFSHVGCSRDV